MLFTPRFRVTSRFDLERIVVRNIFSIRHRIYFIRDGIVRVYQRFRVLNVRKYTCRKTFTIDTNRKNNIIAKSSRD